MLKKKKSTETILPCHVENHSADDYGVNWSALADLIFRGARCGFLIFNTYDSFLFYNNG